MPHPVPLTLGTLAALRDAAAQPFARLLLAHGAGAGMNHPFMAAIAAGLARRGVETLRYQFPYMQAGRRLPGRPEEAQAAVRTAAATASDLRPALPLFAGGKSYGARMTSQAQSAAPLPGVHGLVFLGFPLHPAGKPSTSRAAHLQAIDTPMLFLQGTRDALADPSLIAHTVHPLRPRATLIQLDHADHAFHVPRSSGRTDAQLLEELLDAATNWMQHVLEPSFDPT